MAKRYPSMAIAFIFIVVISVTQGQVNPGDIEGVRLWLKAHAEVTTEDNSGHRQQIRSAHCLLRRINPRNQTKAIESSM
jgi:hypothetical protein